MTDHLPCMSRRQMLAGTLSGATAALSAVNGQAQPKQPAQIAITLDLEMSRHYPRRGMTEWDYQKGNLDEATKQYSAEAAKIAKSLGARIHFFCVARVLEQPSVKWLQDIAAAGHPIGNHTYDHVNVLATRPLDTQFRFQRAPWLIAGRTVPQILKHNIHMASVALKTRAGIAANGFRTPGGFYAGLSERPDVQQILVDEGFDWVSAKYPRHLYSREGQSPTDKILKDIVRAQREAQPFAYPSGLIEIPMSPISDVGAFRTSRWKLPDFLESIRRCVTWAIETGGVFDFLGHPSCLVVEDPNFESIKLICKLVNQAGPRAQLATLDQIAKRVRPS